MRRLPDSTKMFSRALGLAYFFFAAVQPLAAMEVETTEVAASALAVAAVQEVSASLITADLPAAPDTERAADLENDLLLSGWSRSVSADGRVEILEKDGVKYILHD